MLLKAIFPMENHLSWKALVITNCHEQMCPQEKQLRMEHQPQGAYGKSRELLQQSPQLGKASTFPAAAPNNTDAPPLRIGLLGLHYI